MQNVYCYRYLCFAPLDATAPKFFGFSEFLTALALMVLAWTIAEARYHFRIRTAPVPLQATTFVIVTAVGVLVHRIMNSFRVFRMRPAGGAGRILL